MVRVPCQICGVEILSATAERNQGLCGRCAKGHRPCIYCGKQVSEPLKGGIYAHMECWVRNRQAKESLGWQSVTDIDWDMVRQTLGHALTSLFQRVAAQHTVAANLALLVYIHVEDFIEVTVFEVGPDGSSKRLSDAEWDKAISPLDSSFSLMYERLSEVDALEASGQVTRSLTAILSDAGSEIAIENFHFPSHVHVSWKVESA